MIERDVLTSELARQVRSLEDDLRKRADHDAEVAATVEAEWRSAHEAGRTAHDLKTWRESLLTQVAVAWVLGTVFVRFCEDNGLITEPLITGPGERARRAEDAQRAWFREHPAEGERGYVQSVFRSVAALPGLSHVFGPHNPLWLFGPSDDAVRGLFAYWREVVPETGELRRDLTDAELSTRFLGDLYQDLSESARKQYALLQTPEFVEEFILDRTLDPAIDEFGLEGFRMIDPACGSGHFLLGAFHRLFDRWQERAPQEGDRALAERALRSVHGVDINPFAAAIARFRLLVAALRASGVRTLAEAPDFTVRVAVGDSLLHGPPPGQQVLTRVEAEDPATRHLFRTEDAESVYQILSGGYHAVVANPPYITPKDPAANAAYRRRHATVCHGKYALTAPFMERLFDLSVRGDGERPAGFVGQITANSFMKREFGKPLIEQFLAEQVDLTHVVDTSGAYIPGHGTPTVILFGRNRRPVGSTARAVLGIRGEPSRPTDPAKGEVWTSITSLIDRPGSENDYVSISDLERGRLVRHPWSLQGGGADELKARLQASARRSLSELVIAIGFASFPGLDPCFVFARSALRRHGVTEDLVRDFVPGEVVRDWGVLPKEEALVPYEGNAEPLVLEPDSSWARLLWPYRASLNAVVSFGGKTRAQLGDDWWLWYRWLADRYRTPLSIAFASVATHNHFVLDRGGKVFKQSAPVIKLPDGASEDAHLELLGLLNSSVACFWMQQVFHNKGGPGGAHSKDEKWHDFYDVDGTKLKQFPIPENSALDWARQLDAAAQELASNLPAAVCARGVPSRAALDEARATVERLRREMVSLQEELDWRCLFLYGVTDDDLSLPPGAAPPIDRGQRAFEIVLARRMASGTVRTTWFERHGSTPITELPEWPDDYKRLVEQRIELIESDQFVGLVERPECKRRWNWDDWADLERDALRTWLLDRLEEPRYWPDPPQPRSAAELADAAARDDEFVQVAQLYAGTVDVDLVAMVSELVRDEAVPYLAAWRYTESGLRKREAWERTWELQRREDAGEDVGPIPVPPKYVQKDFADAASWRLRGKLDVPKERFISYPGLGRDTDPTPLVGWAGWNHLQAAQALAAVYEQRRSADGWDSKRLTPALAGLAELVPWLRQWHNDVDPATGLRLGDFFAQFVDTEAATAGVSLDDLAAWRPERATTRRRKKASA